MSDGKVTRGYYLAPNGCCRWDDEPILLRDTAIAKAQADSRGDAIINVLYVDPSQPGDSRVIGQARAGRWEWCSP